MASTVVKMHADEADTDVSLVRRLLAAQFPQWADLGIHPVSSAGTDHALYRIGDDLVARFPRIHGAVGQIDVERRWLPYLAPHVPLAIPLLLAKGDPGQGYPYPWAVYRWIEGESVAFEDIADPNHAAVGLAHFITALQRVDTMGGPLPGPDDCARGKPLAPRDKHTREAIRALKGIIETDTVTAAWEASLRTPAWNRAPVWIHGDLLPSNLLFERGLLNAVIDFGSLCVGDPACDLMIAWNLFSDKSRDVFRATMQVDDATWARGRGWALSQALIFIPYYLDTNPVGVGYARRAVTEIVEDYKKNG
ncbi:MAG: aminoglycoside phosphotransferase family protein [candidate division Zixibacteria bacterium]|nr:aminoglycoside phosphotransferase family protein [candidate division Zixibacteria bacterium]